MAANCRHKCLLCARHEPEPHVVQNGLRSALPGCHPRVDTAPWYPVETEDSDNEKKESLSLTLAK